MPTQTSTITGVVQAIVFPPIYNLDGCFLHSWSRDGAGLSWRWFIMIAERAQLGGAGVKCDRSKAFGGAGGQPFSARLFQSRSNRARYFLRRSASFTLDRCAREAENRARPAALRDE